MVSIFGFVSLFITIVCVAAIVLHSKVMRRRAPVDTHMAQLEDLLRLRVEIMYNLSPVDSPLHELCAQCVDADFANIMATLPSITETYQQAYRDATWDEIHNDLQENTESIEETITNLNQVIEKYNNYITANSSGMTMAWILGLSTEEPLASIFTIYEESNEEIPQPSENTSKGESQ